MRGGGSHCLSSESPSSVTDTAGKDLKQNGDYFNTVLSYVLYFDGKMRVVCVR